MATCAVVNASSKEKQEKSLKPKMPRKIYFGIFFDGTGNNMIQYADAVNFRKQQGGGSWWEAWNWNDEWEVKENAEMGNEYGANKLGSGPIKKNSDYSNVAILHSVYRAMSPEQLQEQMESHKVYMYNIYVEGPGQEEVSTHTKAQDALNMGGSGWGLGSTGVVALVSKAVAMVRIRIDGLGLDKDDELHFDVFGFSRGAACARLFSYLVGRDSTSTLGCENQFGKYAANKEKWFKQNRLHFLDEFNLKKEVDFLGIYDTVPSIGSEDEYKNNCTDYGLFSPNEKWVKHTFHLCAMDEFRAHFGLTNIGDAATSGDNAEIYVPGCHSDVGGGYPAGEFSFTLTTGKKMYNDAGVAQTIEKTGAVLRALGWLDTAKTKVNQEGKEVKDNLSTLLNLGSITVSRYSGQGYNVIPLNMMSARANQKAEKEAIANGRDMFDMENISQGRFEVCADLSELCQNMVKESKNATGRLVMRPEQFGYPYHDLRRDYLHFTSTTEKFKVWNRLIHGPSYDSDNTTICRYLFSGNEGEKTRGWIHYKGNEIA